MKRLDFRRAQQEIHKIKEKLGQSPATFDYTPPAEPQRLFTCEQILAILLLLVMVAIVFFGVFLMLTDYLSR